MILDKHKIIFVHINRTGGTSIEKFFNSKLHDHSCAQHILAEVGKEKWNEYFKFSIVRNPWDRLVSAYSRRVKCNELCSSVTFKDWFFEIRNEWWVVQSNWLNSDLDHVGRFENLNLTYELICNKCNLKNKIQHINKTKHFHYSFYYNKEMIYLVEKICKKDINKFKYSYFRHPRIYL